MDIRDLNLEEDLEKDIEKDLDIKKEDIEE